MAFIGAITWARCGLLVVAQTVGAIVASYLVYGLFGRQLNVDTVLNEGVSPGQGVVIEIFLTALVCFTIFMLAAKKHESTHLAPLGIGFSLLIAHLAGM
jgi:aquaporin related protein